MKKTRRLIQEHTEMLIFEKSCEDCSDKQVFTDLLLSCDGDISNSIEIKMISQIHDRCF